MPSPSNITPSALRGVIAHAVNNEGPEQTNALSILGLPEGTDTSDAVAMMATARNLMGVARYQVERAESIADLKDARGYAEAVGSFIRARNLGIEAENEAATTVIVAEWKMGKELIRMEDAGLLAKPGRAPGGSETYNVGVTTFAELGIETNASHRWRSLARQYADLDAVFDRLADTPRVSRAALLAGDGAISRKVKVYKDPLAEKDEAEFDTVKAVRAAVAAVEALRPSLPAIRIDLDVAVDMGEEREYLATEVEAAARLLVTILKVLRGGSVA